MPEEGVPFIPHAEILRFEEIRDVVKVAVRMGVEKVRLTGGEPLVRKGIVDLVRMIAEVPGVKDFSMTTNGILLGEFAVPLAEAGLQRVNVSLDSLDPETYAWITRGGDVSKVLAGIEAARNAGLGPIKVNCVIKESRNEKDAVAVRDYCHKNGLQIRYIREMNLHTGEFGVVDGGSGGDCRHCNRLRLTSNGMIKPCLFSDLEFSVRELGARQAIEKALIHKPEKGTVNLQNCFNNIGG
jgi:cyclic pyranopterin phosphate synthase